MMCFFGSGVLGKCFVVGCCCVGGGRGFVVIFVVFGVGGLSVGLVDEFGNVFLGLRMDVLVLLVVMLVGDDVICVMLDVGICRSLLVEVFMMIVLFLLILLIVFMKVGMFGLLMWIVVFFWNVGVGVFVCVVWVCCVIECLVCVIE